MTIDSERDNGSMSRFGQRTVTAKAIEDTFKGCPIIFNNAVVKDSCIEINVDAPWENNPVTRSRSVVKVECERGNRRFLLTEPGEFVAIAFKPFVVRFVAE